VNGGIHIAFGTAKAPDKALVSWWYTLIGVVIALVVGGLISLRHRTDAPEAAEANRPDEPDTDRETVNA